MRRLFAFALVAAACGGSKGQVTAPDVPPGDTHVPSPPATPMTPVDAGTSATAKELTSDEPPAGGLGGIVIKNDGDSDLNFGITKGWGVAVFAYTGKPPKAKSVTLFEAACMASCEAEGDNLCPVCPEPKDKKEEQAMAKTETVAAGKSFTVPWDGRIVVYETVKGKRRCKCWRKEEPPADTYTVKACGLRPPREPGKPSKPVCTETEVKLGPEAATPPVITLSFK